MPRPVPPEVVRAAIARAILGSRSNARENREAQEPLGSVTLLPHQVDAVERIRAILRIERVALLADDVGMGKTFTALAIARAYTSTRIIAPAALLPMWREAIARVHGVGVHVESMHRYSRERHDMVPAAPRTLVIIDEAHHLRSPHTKRYRAIAKAVSGCDLLLVSATPLHNTARDLRALLALASGTDAAMLTEQRLARVIVRRTDEALRPRVSVRAPVVVPHDPALLDAILELPAPLPAHDGAVAGALIRLGLLRAWCSSDAALASTLRRRVLRGEALQQALEAGRHPSSAELRSWLVGEHEVQLAFPELLAGHAPETGPLLEVLRRHLDAVRALLARQRQDRRGDVARAESLRRILAAHPATPIVAFSQFAETVRAVARALADIAGVGALTGPRGWIASGAISRAEALAHFAPVAQGRPPPPSHQRIRLLLTTDLLAEGVNLQDAGVVVHLDLPWTDALKQQRVGRCVRVGSTHHEVVVYEFEPPRGAESVLRLVARLRRKARLAARCVGGLRTVSGDRRVERSPADEATEIREILRAWAQADTATRDTPPYKRVSRDVPLCCVLEAACDGIIALVRADRGDVLLLAGRRGHRPDGRSSWRLSTSPRRVRSLLRAAAAGAAEVPATRDSRPQAAWTHAMRAVEKWLARRALATDMGDDEWQSSSVHRRARVVLTQLLARVSPARRIGLRAAFGRTFHMLSQARGVAAEDALRGWLRSLDRQAPGDVEGGLTSWQSVPVLAAAAGRADANMHRSPAPEGRRRVLAVILLATTESGTSPASFGACLDSPSCSTSTAP